jgi:NADH:ubiquinone oxidoreductase subunit F (NADH-binding)
MAQKNEAEFLDELLSEPDNQQNSKEQVGRLAKKYGLRPYEAQNVWSFYKQNQDSAKICRGLPCALKQNGTEAEVLRKLDGKSVEEVSCLGHCDNGPVAWSRGKYYRILEGKTMELDSRPSRQDFKQINSLQQFLEIGGFGTLTKAMGDKTREDTLKLVKEFNIRGFGGSGFPAYVKWKAVSDSLNSEKYLIVNAHEGEPGTFKDRILIDSNPFELIEASFLAAITVGASNIIIALKHEYLETEKELDDALENSLEYLNDKIGPSELPGLKILRVPGYYITGEESALMEAIEGRRSEPRLRPPYPAEVGLYGKPTLIDNVETLLYFLGRLREWTQTGNKGMGEKVYCLSGDVERPGAYLMPYGTPSGTLLTQRGGSEFSDLKAILPGGLSGGILPADHGDLNLDFDSLKGTGAGMGTGAFIAISKGRCMVDVMSTVESFFERESCGKCMPCRYGTRELSELFRDLKNGTATESSIESAKITADVMMRGSICGLGQAAAKMFFDSMRYFSGELEEHASGNCPSNICFREER